MLTGSMEVEAATKDYAPDFISDADWDRMRAEESAADSAADAKWDRMVKEVQANRQAAIAAEIRMNEAAFARMNAVSKQLIDGAQQSLDYVNAVSPPPQTSFTP